MRTPASPIGSWGTPRPPDRAAAQPRHRPLREGAGSARPCPRPRSCGLAERLIALAKHEENRLHARRLAARHIQDPAVVKKLFDTIGSRSRPGPAATPRSSASAPARATGRRWPTSSSWATSTSLPRRTGRPRRSRRTRRNRSPRPRRRSPRRRRAPPGRRPSQRRPGRRLSPPVPTVARAAARRGGAVAQSGRRRCGARRWLRLGPHDGRALVPGVRGGQRPGRPGRRACAETPAEATACSRCRLRHRRGRWRPWTVVVPPRR